jgi:pimeloyl-ACP methyl ester carboxylesterase
MPAIVMGHSLGSLVSATLAVEHPEKVRGLVLVDAPYYFTGGVTEQMLAPVRGNLEEAPAKLASSWETLPGVYNERTPEWLKAFHRLRTWGTPANVVVATGEELWGRNESIGKWENAKGYLQKGLGSKTGKERVPRLVVVANDRVNQEKEIGLDTEGAGDRVEVIMDGHWLHQQSAERFNGVVAAWLRGRGFVPSLPT